MENLFELLYTSVIVPEESPACVANIIKVARRNNAIEQITGVLIFDGQHFCQYLEGPQSAVLKLVETISHDPRHTSFDIKEQAVMAGSRRFADWSMGYALAYREEVMTSFNQPGNLSPIALLQTLLPSFSFPP